MIGEAGPRLVDEVSGRRVKGDRAVYTLVAKTVEIFGEEVQLIDADNNKMQGRYLVYDLENDKVNIGSRVPDGLAESP